MTPALLATSAVLLSFERFAYVWIARRPQSFETWAWHAPLVGGDPVDVVGTLFTIFKIVQAAVFVAWCWICGNGALIASRPSVLVLTTGAALVVAGQYLNLRVFRLLGRTGVFYGDRFGITLPWHTEFPFSLLSHPQYVGTCLSIWGLFMIARFPHPDWYVLPLLESVYYAAGAHLESGA